MQASPLVERIEFSQLDYADRTLHIRQAEIVPAVIEVLPPEPLAHRETRFIQRAIFGASAIDSSAVRAIEGDALEHSRIIGNNHAAFSERGNIFLFVEAEASGRAHAAGLASFVFTADGMTGVLDDRNVVPFGHGEDWIQIGRAHV